MDTVKTTQVALTDFGISMNFGAGKSEVVLMYHGHHSRAPARQWLSVEKPSIPVELHSGAVVTLVVAEQYVHLGNVVHHSAGDGADYQPDR